MNVPESVLVVGAGVAGVQVCRALDKQGIPYSLVEESNGVGGVWRENYYGYGLQVPAAVYEFAEFPYPEKYGVKPLTYPDGATMRRYVNDYIDHFNIRRKIRFNTKFEKAVPLDPTGQRVGWKVTLTTKRDGRDVVVEEEWDYLVMAIGISNRPSVPTHYKDLEAFQGEIVACRHLTSADMFRGKRLLVVGGNKSALGIAENAAPHCPRLTLLFRRAHWIVPYWVLGYFSPMAFLHRAANFMFPPGFYTSQGLYRWFEDQVQPLKRLFEWVSEQAVLLTTGIDGDLLPEASMFVDSTSPAGALAGTEFFKMIKTGVIQPVKGDIDRFTKEGVVLRDGRSLEGYDMIVLATGYHNDYSYLPPNVQQKLNVQPDGLYLYRHILPPRVPGLAFVGSECFTMEGILTAGLQSEWLAQYLVGRMEVPAPEEQEVDVEACKEWKRSWMLPSKKRASFVGMHGLYYHDQLLRDMGFPVYLHGCDLVTELLLPIVSKRYSPVFFASAQGTSPDPAPHRISRPRRAPRPQDKVELPEDLPYGGISSDLLIKKGILSCPDGGMTSKAA
eukprot:jgi/Botrbrau1/4231/Bobra.0044s0026.2